MITRLPNNILNKIARYTLITHKDSSKSWFIHIKYLCQLYKIPHPLIFLERPPSKSSAKHIFKTQVTDYWQTKLRMDASRLPSLEYFKPQYMSLLSPHPLWSTCGSNPYEICKAIVQAKMLSGRYRTDQLLRHFIKTDGACSICNDNTLGSIKHLLLLCPALNETRARLMKNLDDETTISESTKHLIKTTFEANHETIQMLVDCSVLSTL